MVNFLPHVGSFCVSTTQLFIHFLRGKRQKRLREICKEELLKLDERWNRGDCLEAVSKLHWVGKSKL